MRTLTLGVLIVAGGTLAALPFRRYKAIPDASSAPAQVTGPTQSSLQTTLPVKVAGDGAANRPAIDLAYGHLQPTTADSVARAETVRKQTRRANIPLSYEDLELPIDQPEPVRQRFNATASIHADRLRRERALEIVMPELDSLDQSQMVQIEAAANQFAAGAEARPQVSGALASTRNAELDPLPKATAPVPDRDRHWIRQPD